MADSDAAITIHLGSGNLSAAADFFPAKGRGAPLTFEMARSKLAELGITTGIHEDVIRRMCGSAGILNGVVIAEAIAPGKGENARIEQYVAISKRSKAKVRKNGSVDFRELGEITAVIPGQKLFRRIPPSQGKSGKDIMGNEIPGLFGKNIRIVLGKGAAFDELDPNLVVAAAEGELILKNGVLHVSEVHEVPGDVDYSTGNLKFLGSILIKGSVRSGFRIEAGGNVQINGNVEDAAVLAECDVSVLGGFAGTGQGLIRAGNDVFIKFVENQNVDAGRDIILTGVSYHSRLRAGRSILAKSGAGAIVGGSSEAKHSVEAARFGSVACTPTIIKVGIDPTLSERLKCIEEEIEKIRKTNEKLEQSVIFLYKLKIDNNGRLPPDKAALLEKLEAARKNLPKRLEILEEQKNAALHEQVSVESAYAIAETGVFPKVKVFFGSQWIANEDSLGPSVYKIFEGDVIRLSK